jgi:hypothetical protein
VRDYRYFRDLWAVFDRTTGRSAHHRPPRWHGGPRRPGGGRRGPGGSSGRASPRTSFSKTRGACRQSTSSSASPSTSPSVGCSAAWRRHPAAERRAHRWSGPPRRAQIRSRSAPPRCDCRSPHAASPTCS